MNSRRDSDLLEQVRSLLANDKDLRGYNLHADVAEGEVQLQGIVDTLSEKERALDLMRQVPGVKRVVDGLSISTDGAITDKDVAFEVQEELQLSDVNLRHIGAKAVGGNGTVVLVGHSNDPAEIEAAMKAAARARGVTRVVNQVKPAVEEPSLYDIFHSQVNNDREE